MLKVEDALKDQEIRITDLEAIKTDRIEAHEKGIKEFRV
jgi:cobalamin biosynthesis protein CbiG